MTLKLHCGGRRTQVCGRCTHAGVHARTSGTPKVVARPVTTGATKLVLKGYFPDAHAGGGGGRGGGGGDCAKMLKMPAAAERSTHEMSTTRSSGGALLALAAAQRAIPHLSQPQMPTPGSPDKSPSPAAAAAASRGVVCCWRPGRARLFEDADLEAVRLGPYAIAC
jgi:hypothetical protein